MKRTYLFACTSYWPIPAYTLLAATVLGVIGCDQVDSRSYAGQAVREISLSGKLVITGSSTVAPLVAEIGKRFEQAYPGVRIDVQAGGSSRGIADARSGTADVGMASRALKAGERDLHAFPIAHDGLCLIVHRRNPVVELTDEQVIAIYTGQARNWRQVGGSDAPITVVHKADGRATQEVFLNYFKIAGQRVVADIIIGDNQHGIKTVAGNPDAIGYVSVGGAAHEAQRGVAIRLLRAGGVEPTASNVMSGAFRISRPLVLVTRDKPMGLAKTFIDYARSEYVHDLVQGQSFLPISR